MTMELYTDQGQRKYLTGIEREAFLKAADSCSRDVRIFCYVLIYSGCRISEALQLKPSRVDSNNNCLVFRSLKKRSEKPIFRSVPIPPNLLDMLNMAYDLKQYQGEDLRLWKWSRPTAWRRVKEVMKQADITGSQATPKGLRHSFGVHAVICGVPLNTLQKWLGHSDIATTAIYASATGKEEKILAQKMWV